MSINKEKEHEILDNLKKEGLFLKVKKKITCRTIHKKVESFLK